LDNDQFTFKYLIENVEVEEKLLKEIWARLTKAFENQARHIKREYKDFDDFSFHFRNYAFKRLKSILKQKNASKDGAATPNTFKCKEQVRDEYRDAKFRKTVENFDWIVSQL
jgi:hypothetical protein